MFTTNFADIDIDQICKYNKQCQLYDNQIIGKRKKKGGTRKKKSKKTRKTRKR